MSKTPLMLVLAALTAPAFAQTPSAPNLVLANNEPYIQTDVQTHPATGVNYNFPGNNPAEYSNGASVLPGTWVWRVFPEKSTVMREPRKVTGFQTIWRASAATPSGVSVAVYAPAVRLMNATQRPGAGLGALDPNFGSTLLTIPEYNTSYTFSGTDRVVAWSVTLASEVPLNISGAHAIAAAYHGGDARDVPATAAAPSQGVLGSVADGRVYDEAANPAPYQPDGFAIVDPFTQQVSLYYKATDDSRTWLTYGTSNPTINVMSDWGRRHVQAPPTQTQLVGFSDGTYYSDMGSTASTGWALEVWADPARFAGGFAMPFVNIGNYFGGVFPVPLGSLGTPVLELLPTDPLFNAMANNLLMFLDATEAIGRSPSVPQPVPIPALVGFYLGFEAAVIDAGFTRMTTTQARWIRFVL